MATSFAAGLRNARADAITTFTGNAGKLRIYTSAYAVLLSENVLGTPFAPGASGGVLTLGAVANATAAATGTAAIARIYKADGTTLVMEGLVVTDTAGAGPVKLAQTGTTITNGQTVVFDSGTITEGNA